MKTKGRRVEILNLVDFITSHVFYVCFLNMCFHVLFQFRLGKRRVQECPTKLELPQELDIEKKQVMLCNQLGPDRLVNIYFNLRNPQRNWAKNL